MVAVRPTYRRWLTRAGMVSNFQISLPSFTLYALMKHFSFAIRLAAADLWMTFRCRRWVR
jgi:hypothetical protein